MTILNLYMLLDHTQPNNTRGIIRYAFSFLFIFLPLFLKKAGILKPYAALKPMPTVIPNSVSVSVSVLPSSRAKSSLSRPFSSYLQLGSTVRTPCRFHRYRDHAVRTVFCR